jgi:hypothetical protein
MNGDAPSNGGDGRSELDQPVAASASTAGVSLESPLVSTAAGGRGPNGFQYDVGGENLKKTDSR